MLLTSFQNLILLARSSVSQIFHQGFFKFSLNRFQVFGGAKHHRPVEDIAYATARFYAKNGTFVNYYMYHGGTNFGRSGGPFITANYDYDAPIDEYGNKREPKWSHLKDLNTAIMLCSRALLSARAKTVSLGPSQEAHVYRGGSRQCAAFLSNMNPNSNATVKFQNLLYGLPAWSVSILPDCKNVVFNTAKVNTQSQTKNFKSNNPLRKIGSSYLLLNKAVEKAFHWETFKENIGGSEDTQFEKKGLLDHISTTKDTTDYLWYKVIVDVDENDRRSNSPLVLAIGSQGYAVHVFVNDHFAGNAFGNKTNPGFSLKLHISLRTGKNYISLLSVMFGLPDSGAYFERETAGISSFVIQGFKGGARDYSQELWTYQIGLAGEKKNIFTKDGSHTVKWNASISNQHLTWYKTTIDAPHGDGPVSLDLRSMGKGQIWINGESVGRYWIPFLVPLEECSRCDYRRWTVQRCATNCGQPSQILYHIPRSLLHPTRNLLVLFEEIGGEPSKVSLLTGFRNN